MAAAELNASSEVKSCEKTVEKDPQKDLPDSPFQPLKAAKERHHSALLQLLAEKLKVSFADFDDFELVLYDFDRARRGGLGDELIFAPRLDNLEMTYCAVLGLVESLKSPCTLDSDHVSLISLFDHEEVGSSSAQGADSSFLPDVLRRLCHLPLRSSDAPQNSAVPSSAFEQSCAQSFIISADMGHAVHPNYAHKHEQNHKPLLNKGPVIKVNASQRYMTNAPGITLIKEVARRAEVPLQMFVSSNEVPCGR